MEAFLLFLKALFGPLSPIAIVLEYQKGVRFFKGRFVSVLGPGLYFKWPLIAEITTENINIQTLALPGQDLTTSDGRNIRAEVFIKFKVINIKKYTLEVMEAADTLNDICTSAVSLYISSNTLRKCMDLKSLSFTIIEHIKTDMRPFGVLAIDLHVQDLQLKPEEILRDTIMDAVIEIKKSFKK